MHAKWLEINAMLKVDWRLWAQPWDYNYPNKAIGLFRIYEWIQKDFNKSEYEKKNVNRFSDVADWKEQFVFGLAEVEQVMREKSLLGLEKNQRTKVKSFL